MVNIDIDTTRAYGLQAPDTTHVVLSLASQYGIFFCCDIALIIDEKEVVGIVTRTITTNSLIKTKIRSNNHCVANFCPLKITYSTQ